MMSARRPGPDVTVVVPTTGRATLRAPLAVLAEGSGPPPVEIVVVDDRPAPGSALPLPPSDVPTRVVRSGGRGPAAARNLGWCSARTEWIAFLDDDVVPSRDWRQRLQEDLDLPEDCAGTQASITVPLPEDRRPTDAERGTAALGRAWWITADMAYRREVLAWVGGFDERFPRAFREDADLALRVQRAGCSLTHGGRTTYHPARPAGPFASVRAQAGNADNALMRRKHGRSWRALVGEGPGRGRAHAVTTLAAALAVSGAVAGRGRRGRASSVALAGAAAWCALTIRFALARILPGPRTPREIATMVVTSALIPPVACWHRLAGELRVRRHRVADRRAHEQAPAVVLFDRDDTLIHDVPYNGDSALVRPVAGVCEALDRLRANRIRVGVVSNQSGIARGVLTRQQVDSVNAEVDRVLGPFDTWQICPHGEAEACDCRKPASGMVERAADELNVDPARCAVVGDTGADVEAALSTGARAVLVPTERTRPEEVRHAWEHAEVARTVAEAVAKLVGAGR